MSVLNNEISRNIWTFRNELGRFHVKHLEMETICVESREYSYYWAFQVTRFADEEYSSDDIFIVYDSSDILQSIINFYLERR